MTKKAVVLLSGGLDSTTTLAIAQKEGYECHCISFDYGQRHKWELQSARKVAKVLNAKQHVVMTMDLTVWGGSALTDENISVPQESGDGDGIPATYVPARNTIFLSFGLAWAEVLEGRHIFIGVNALDYSGYPDCRPEYIQAYETMANLATKAGVEGHKIKIHTPLIDLTKGDIVTRGLALGVDYSLTHSCYNPNSQGLSCRQCDACKLRLKGFSEAGVADPLVYQGGDG